MASVSFGRALTLHAERDPHRPAITVDERTMARAELDALANRMARVFAADGVGEGDFVTIGLPNSAEFFAAAAACWKLGAIPQPVSAKLPHAEREAIVELAGSKVVLGAEPHEHAGRVCYPLGWTPSETVDGSPLAEDRVSVNWKAPTSGGSTGRPKLIVDAAPAKIDPLPGANTAGGQHQDGCVLIPGPMYHNAGFSYASRALLTGNHLVTMTRFDALATLEAIERHRPDWALLVPTMMLRIARLPNHREFDTSSLTTVWHMAAPCPPWLKEHWIDWLGGEKIYELYAGTEAQAVTIIRGDEWLAHRGSVGRPVIGEMRVQGEDGSVLPAGEVGEVFMRAAEGRTTYRYIGAEAKRSDDGWESLGDLGWMDADGYVYLTDRLGDMILSGGANVYPAEVEHAIDEHPSVQSSAVIGLPDEDLGNAVHAIVHLRPGAPPAGADELAAFVGERLVRYKVPRTWEFSDETLRDDAGKVRRSALRAARVARPTSGDQGEP